MVHSKNRMQDCGYSGETLDFVYGEMAGAAKDAFERHLVACERCGDEVATLSSASLAVSEWRNTAFDPLATPRFSFPAASPPRIGILAAIFGLFRPPVYAAAAATLLIGSAIGIYFLLNGDGSQPQVARSDDMPAIAVATSTVQAAEPALAEKKQPIIAKRERPADQPDSDRSARPQGSRQVRNARRAADSTQNRVVAANATPGQTVPEDLFGDIPDSRDRSLRLTDLFAEGDED